MINTVFVAFKHLPQVRICFFGESFVNGTGDPECLGWAGRICVDANRKGYDITYYNLGIRRETTTELAKRWLQEVSLRLPPEYNGRIVFSFGVNDTTLENGKTRVEFTKSIENARNILSNAQELDKPILMVSPPPVADEAQNKRIADLSTEFAEICNQINVPYLNVFTELQSKIWMDEAQANDGAHPFARGYQEFAEIVQKWDAWLSWFPSNYV